MRRWLFEKRLLRQPWVITVILIAALPLLPEYAAPPLAIAALAVAAVDARRHRRVYTVGTLGKWMLLYLLFFALGVAYSVARLTTLVNWLMWFSMLTGYVALHTVLTSKRRISIALLGISGAAGVAGGIAVAQYLLKILGVIRHTEFWYPLDALAFRLSPVPVNLQIAGDRVCATFTNPNILAEYLVMVIPFVAFYAFTGLRTKARLFSRGCLLAAVGGVMFTFARGSYLALTAVAIVFAAANLKRIGVVVLAAFSLASLLPASVAQRLFSISRAKKSLPPALADELATALPGSDKAISERFQVWMTCWDNILRHPLLGSGGGTTGTLLAEHGLNVPHAHNVVLQLLNEGGLVGLAIMLAAGFRALQTGVRLTRLKGDTRRVGVTVLAFLAGFGVNSMFEFPLFTPKLVGIFLTVLALIDAFGRVYLTLPASPLAGMIPLPTRTQTDDPASVK
ncbi:MAG: O-antigen ligase family protein [Acutalibacteraceae bacterium]